MIATGTQVKISNIKELPVGIGQVYRVNNEEIAVFRLSNGKVYAIENKSPHPKGGRLADGLVSGEYLFCPIHDWKISLIDGTVQAPDQGKVKSFQVDISNNEGVIYL
ncbi:nitrite reductase small subunit NirD [Halalkalibacter akibai]|uniref:Nitrite reductase n=1 Tax=Halalkalibacter akibai (strain ATCC 43226 / DSM 21942 / CIP 109018 / JCM 9157 / 1139) TaxID=1236973 RepID=W4QU46_HALA3|nr:nitrite reductase small subunit NirD [Halalkalibacter akibai]GAE35133.1 nitrite reductase [Halalkalibacter akibai JCM 9157]